MPDLPSRRDREAEIAAALILLFNRQRETGVFLPGAFAYGVADALREPLAKAYYEAATRLAGDYKLPVNDDDLMAKAATWAQSKAGFTADRIGHRLDMASAKAKMGSITPADFHAAVTDVFSDSYAEVVAATEITGAITAGEAGMVVLAGYTGIDLFARWHTAMDSLVCLDCLELDGQPEEVWQLSAPAGPPSHPNCRCWLDYEE